MLRGKNTIVINLKIDYQINLTKKFGNFKTIVESSGYIIYEIRIYLMAFADSNNKFLVAIIPSFSLNLSPSYSTPIYPV